MKSLRNDVSTCRTISMCEVKYIWNFIVTLFIQPMKDIILQFSRYLSKTKQTAKNSQRMSKQSISFEFLIKKIWIGTVLVTVFLY
jgi:hypothetical protein